MIGLQEWRELEVNPNDCESLTGVEQWILLQLEKAGCPVEWKAAVLPSQVVYGEHYKINSDFVRLDQHDGTILFRWRVKP